MKDTYRQQAENERVTGFTSADVCVYRFRVHPAHTFPSFPLLCFASSMQRMAERLEATMRANGELTQELEDAQVDLAITREEADAMQVRRRPSAIHLPLLPDLPAPLIPPALLCSPRTRR
jgi:hypothetical protein